MKIFYFIFLLFLSVHALIHLMGFTKGFQLADPKGLTMQISRPMGFLWLCAFFLLSASILLIALNKPYWWIAGLASVMVSQYLIIAYWREN